MPLPKGVPPARATFWLSPPPANEINYYMFQFLFNYSFIHKKHHYCKENYKDNSYYSKVLTFQFLIGMLKTYWLGENGFGRFVFQFLIGTLKTLPSEHILKSKTAMFSSKLANLKVNVKCLGSLLRVS